MSIEVSSAVWHGSRSKGSARLVLLAIADCTNHDGGGAYPSVAYLARVTLLSRRTVQEILQQLEHLGELTVRRAVGRGHHNSYTVHLDVLRRRYSYPPPFESDGKGAETAPFIEDETTRSAASAEKVRTGAEKVRTTPRKGAVCAGKGAVANHARVDPELTGANRSKPELRGARAKQEPLIEEHSWEPPEDCSEAVVAWHETLKDVRRYQPPSPRFFDRLQNEWSVLNLEDEAIEARDWLLSRAGRQRDATEGFLQGWLNRSLDRLAQRVGRARISKEGSREATWRTPVGNGGGRRLAPASAFAGIDSGPNRAERPVQH